MSGNDEFDNYIELVITSSRQALIEYKEIADATNKFTNNLLKQVQEKETHEEKVELLLTGLIRLTQYQLSTQQQNNQAIFKLTRLMAQTASLQKQGFQEIADHL